MRRAVLKFAKNVFVAVSNFPKRIGEVIFLRPLICFGLGK